MPAIVARKTFPSQTVQSTSKHIKAHQSTSKHTIFVPLRKLRCSNSARCCGAKHISKSKCAKQTLLGPLLEVDMSKKCTPLWRQAHFQVKTLKKMTGSDHFWTFTCRIAWQAKRILHLVKSQQNAMAFVISGPKY